MLRLIFDIHTRNHNSGYHPVIQQLKESCNTINASIEKEERNKQHGRQPLMMQ